MEEVSKVFYYGVGCWDVWLKSIVQKVLDWVFGNVDIEVYYDLLGAVCVICGYDLGIFCIIGMGFNSCLYDGKDVIDNVINLGYLLGDEGFGIYLGKCFIWAFFYWEMFKKLYDELEESLKGGK